MSAEERARGDADQPAGRARRTCAAAVAEAVHQRRRAADRPDVAVELRPGSVQERARAAAGTCPAAEEVDLGVEHAHEVVAGLPDGQCGAFVSAKNWWYWGLRQRDQLDGCEDQPEDRPCSAEPCSTMRIGSRMNSAQMARAGVLPGDLGGAACDGPGERTRQRAMGHLPARRAPTRVTHRTFLPRPPGVRPPWPGWVSARARAQTPGRTAVTVSQRGRAAVRSAAAVVARRGERRGGGRVSWPSGSATTSNSEAERRKKADMGLAAAAVVRSNDLRGGDDPRPDASPACR